MFKLPGYDLTQTIYRGRHTVLLGGRRLADGQAVIIKKTAAEDASAQDRAYLRHEYELLRSLDLPGVVRAYALEECAGGPALVLEAQGG